MWTTARPRIALESAAAVALEEDQGTRRHLPLHCRLRRHSCSARQSTETCRALRARSSRCSALSIWTWAARTSCLDTSARRLDAPRMSLLEFGWSSMRRPGASPEPDNRSLDCGQLSPQAHRRSLPQGAGVRQRLTGRQNHDVHPGLVRGDVALGSVWPPKGRWPARW
jgi:hypothetical protein